MEDVATFLAVAVVAGGWAADVIQPRARGLWARIEEWREPSTVEKIHEEYASGEIGIEEMERRLADALDPREERIREAVRGIDGVGPTRAAEIARSFGSLEAVRRASVDELAAVEHVGEGTAQKIREFFDSRSSRARQ